jgi:hypothetical protein
MQDDGGMGIEIQNICKKVGRYIYQWFTYREAELCKTIFFIKLLLIRLQLRLLQLRIN